MRDAHSWWLPLVAAVRLICGVFLLAPASISAATLYSAFINTPSGSQGTSNSPTPVAITQPRTTCAGAASTCWSASASAGLSLAEAGLAQAQAPAGTGPLSVSVNAGASISGYNVVLSGPSGESTMTSLNLTFDGFAGVSATPGYDAGLGSASVNIGTTLTGPNGAATDSGALTGNWAVTTGSGLLSEWPGFPLAITTSSLLVNAGDIVTIGLSLGGQASCSTQGFLNSLCPAFFNVSRFSFPAAGPVFDLPVGWTANSFDGTIVNNFFVIPEPSAALLLLGGLLGLAGWRRVSA